MWKFNLLNNTWEYVNGNKTPDVLSNYDVPYPGGLFSSSMLIDNTDSYLYLFGGRNTDAGILYIQANWLVSNNDLWKYNLLDNVWELLNSNQTIDQQPGVVYSQTMAINNTDNSLYVFGGTGNVNGTGVGIYNILSLMDR